MPKNSIGFIIFLTACGFFSGCQPVQNDTASAAFTVGGSLTGLQGQIVIQNNLADDLTLTADGPFTFERSINVGDRYQISIQTQPETQRCGISHKTGTITGAHITDVKIFCAAPVSFKNSIAPLLQSRCAYSGCHAGTTPVLGLNLETTHSYDNLVYAGSRLCPSLSRVMPEEPDVSFLLVELNGSGPCFTSTSMRMPKNQPPLSAEEINLVHHWITQGALNN